MVPQICSGSKSMVICNCGQEPVHSRLLWSRAVQFFVNSVMIWIMADWNDMNLRDGEGQRTGEYYVDEQKLMHPAWQSSCRWQQTEGLTAAKFKSVFLQWTFTADINKLLFVCTIQPACKRPHGSLYETQQTSCVMWCPNCPQRLL